MNCLPSKGLKNYGNVCYISSLFMALSSLRKFPNYVMDNRINRLPNNRGCLLKEIRHLFNALFNENDNAEVLYYQLLSKMYTFAQGYWVRDVQGDAQEVFIFLNSGSNETHSHIHTGIEKHFRGTTPRSERS